LLNRNRTTEEDAVVAEVAQVVEADEED